MRALLQNGDPSTKSQALLQICYVYDVIESSLNPCMASVSFLNSDYMPDTLQRYFTRSFMFTLFLKEKTVAHNVQMCKLKCDSKRLVKSTQITQRFRYQDQDSHSSLRLQSFLFCLKYYMITPNFYKTDLLNCQVVQLGIENMYLLLPSQSTI